jgi:hypothetical protein
MNNVSSSFGQFVAVWVAREAAMEQCRNALWPYTNECISSSWKYALKQLFPGMTEGELTAQDWQWVRKFFAENNNPLPEGVVPVERPDISDAIRKAKSKRWTQVP